MTGADWIALLPLMIVSGTVLVTMVSIAVHRSHRLTVGLTLLGVALSLASLWPAAGAAPRQVTPLLVIDGYALFYIGLITASTAVVVLLSYGYFERCEGDPEELYVLLLLATLGSQVLVCSTHFASFFLGLEILSVALYSLIAYLRTRRRSLEAGIKYLVLAASSAAFLLFGMALIYAEIGTMSFAGIAERLSVAGGLHPVVLVAGATLIVTGIGFKLGVVPFHLWTPDVFEGSPAPVTAFIATVSKGTIFALLLRFFYGGSLFRAPALYLVFTIVAIASMVAGNLLALRQNNVKRILAYSSIAHFGYLLVAFLAAGVFAVQAVAFYLVSYFITTLGAFGVIALLSDGARDADDLDQYRGLFWRRPVLASVFTLMILSLAGIPITAGFLGKFYIIAAGASSSAWMLIIILAVTSVIGLFYYLRIVVALFSELPTTAASEPLAPSPSPATWGMGGGAIIVLALLLVWIGVYPGPVLDLIRAAVSAAG